MTGVSVGGMISIWSIGGGNVSDMSEVSVVLNGASGQMMSGMTDGVGSRGSVGSLGVHLVDGSGMGVHLVDGGSVMYGLDGMEGWGGVGNVVGWGSNVCWGSVHGMSVDGRGGLGDDGVESVHIIGCVVDGTDRTVGLNEGVLSLHDISITDLMLGFDITGVAIGNSVVERVLRVRILRTRKYE